MANDLRTMSALEIEICGDFHSIDSKHIKGYKKLDQLLKVLKEHGATRSYGRPMIVCKSDGRYTAIIAGNSLDGNLTAFPGFMKV